MFADVSRRNLCRLLLAGRCEDVAGVLKRERIYLHQPCNKGLGGGKRSDMERQ